MGLMTTDQLFKRVLSTSSGMRTKLSIVHAIDRPIAQMSVREICDKCGISRQTFYYHFGSKFDIPYWYADFCQTFYLDQMGRSYTCHEGFSGHFHLLLLERDMLYYSATDYDKPSDKLRKIDERRHTIAETLTDYCDVVMTDRLGFAVQFFTYAEAEMARRWYRTRMEVPPETFADEMVCAMPSELREAFDGHVMAVRAARGSHRGDENLREADARHEHGNLA